VFAFSAGMDELLPKASTMEVYFKELISKDATLEKLVDDLARVVQGTDDYARSIGVDLTEHPSSEVAHRLHRLKQDCQRIREDIIAQALATDKLVRKNPYAFAGAALVTGVFVGARAGRQRQKRRFWARYRRLRRRRHSIF
jgi:ElaB/YqjD/DUF883 family membrane-anchored ribosome-binding protein